MNGCIYRTKDGECDLYAEGGKYTAFCEMENCVGRKMSNADRIRSMTDEELATMLYEQGCFAPNCDHYDVCYASCRECWLAWLKEEAKDG